MMDKHQITHSKSICLSTASLPSRSRSADLAEGRCAFGATSRPAAAMAPLGTGVPALISSPALMSALLAFSFAQSAKVFTHWYSTGKLDWGRIVGSGGMPSSHTALVVGLTTAVGLKESLDSSIFALCLVFSLVVMYDATGVRLQAGRQAEILNQMILELPTQHPVSDTRPLRDSLGHTPVEVGAGAMVGVVIGWLHYSMWITQWGP